MIFNINGPPAISGPVCSSWAWHSSSGVYVDLMWTWTWTSSTSIVPCCGRSQASRHTLRRSMRRVSVESASRIEGSINTTQPPSPSLKHERPQHRWGPTLPHPPASAAPTLSLVRAAIRPGSEFVVPVRIETPVLCPYSWQQYTTKN